MLHRVKLFNNIFHSFMYLKKTWQPVHPFSLFPFNSIMEIYLKDDKIHFPLIISLNSKLLVLRF